MTTDSGTVPSSTTALMGMDPVRRLMPFSQLFDSILLGQADTAARVAVKTWRPRGIIQTPPGREPLLLGRPRVGTPFW